MGYFRDRVAWKHYLKLKGLVPPGSMLPELSVYEKFGPDITKKVIDKYKRVYPERHNAELQALDLREDMRMPNDAVNKPQAQKKRRIERDDVD